MRWKAFQCQDELAPWAKAAEGGGSRAGTPCRASGRAGEQAGCPSKAHPAPRSAAAGLQSGRGGRIRRRGGLGELWAAGCQAPPGTGWRCCLPPAQPEGLEGSSKQSSDSPWTEARAAQVSSSTQVARIVPAQR